jgi:Alpha/beta hydrolase domain
MPFGGLSTTLGNFNFTHIGCNLICNIGAKTWVRLFGRGLEWSRPLVFQGSRQMHKLLLVAAAISIAFSASGSARSAPLQPASVRPVPDDGRLPLASAHYTKGAEYSDLAAAGYVEAEFYLTGTADAINAANGAVVAEAQPYVTRILVRRPDDARRFSGNVVIEPFSFGGERAGGWTKIRKHLLRHGDAWIGITLLSGETPSHSPAGPQGLGQLKNYSAERYAPLRMYEGLPGQFQRATAFSKGVLQADSFAPQGQMILGELAKLVKSGGVESPLIGLVVRRIYTLTWQVQSQLWIDYLKYGRASEWRMPDGRPLIDGYILGNYSGNLPLPNNLPIDAPVVIVRSARETSNNARDGISVTPDSEAPMLRIYDLTGSAHIGARDVGSGSLQIAEHGHTTGPAGPPPRPGRPEICATGLSYDEPVEVVVSAIYAHMDEWVRTHKPIPRAPRVMVAGKATLNDPATGIVAGGLRPPWIEVPAAKYLVGDEVGCGAMDVKVPYTSEQLRARYGSYARYVAAYRDAAARFAKAGFLLSEDRQDVRPIATAGDFK